MKVIRFLGFAVLLAATVPAQLSVGDIGVTGFSTTQFSVLHGSGTPTSYVAGSFGGTNTTQAIIWDRYNPNDFIVGGFGFVGRATITGPGTVTYTLITTQINTASQMSWDVGTTDLIVFDAGIDQVVRLDPVLGTVTPITTGVQPWGATLNAGAVDPSTGDIYVGTQNNIWRIPVGTSAPLPAPLASGLGGYVAGIAFDPVTSEVVAAIITANRVARISPAGVLSDIIPPASVSGVNSVAIDQNGDFVIGGSNGSVYRASNPSSSPVLIGTATGQGTSASGVSVVGADAFLIIVSPSGGGGTVTITGIPQYTLEGWTVLSLDTTLPVNQGPILGMNPDSLSFLILTAFPVPNPGDPFHWSWPVSAPLYPAAPFVIPPGSIGPGVAIDFIGLAITAISTFHATPVQRVMF